MSLLSLQVESDLFKVLFFSDANNQLNKEKRFICQAKSSNLFTFADAPDHQTLLNGEVGWGSEEEECTIIFHRTQCDMFDLFKLQSVCLDS